MVDHAITKALTKSPIQEFLRDPSSGIPFLQKWFRNWLKLDITTLASILTLLGTIQSAFSSIQDWGVKLYWWLKKIFTSTISIAANDKLNRVVLEWLAQNVLEHRGTKILTAQTESNNPWDGYHPPAYKKPLDGKRVPVQYLPTFGTTWFLHKRNIFSVSLIHPETGNRYDRTVPDDQVSAPTGKEALLITCLGRSVAPIKKFIEDCRDFSEKQKEQFTTVYTAKLGQSIYWAARPPKPKRPLHTVHFDEAMKADLVKDIKDYLTTEMREFYQARGIPYRRGYLLYGPPGTGKTSLCLAIAGHFGLDLFQLHIPSLDHDNDLESLFSILPPKCLVVLEDIDAIGSARKMDITDEKAAKTAKSAKENDGEKEKGDVEDDSDDDSEFGDSTNRKTGCTLSGLLNVLDGVSSQEGRILFMTSNVAHRLDKALIRPGRIDRMIYLAEMSKDSARLMFLRMYSRGNSGPSVDGSVDEKLEKLALEFERAVPDKIFTPAQLQGYMLKHRQDPAAAVAGISTWIADETVMKEEAKKRAKKAKAEKKEAERKQKENDEKEAAEEEAAEEKEAAVRDFIVESFAGLKKAVEDELGKRRSGFETKEESSAVTAMKETESKEAKSAVDAKDAADNENESPDESKDGSEDGSEDS